ncbi:metallophosphoesterase family protein [Falsiroseomonas oryzae]|uniref:metallophosphoesterase family protein n=1 Tax=Falsiroseomonas oryzae TaxID=2766473 RepID=UPI0022EAEA43|nr:DNA repair exonuclease [Roseomonas sp. MO-31]
MKFLHAADIHLDSPLAGLQAQQGLPAGLLRHCTRRALAAMVDLAIAEDVAFVVIAGDLYDGDWKDFSTGLFVAEQMRRLARPCFVLRGNHDARSVITRELRLPPNVREFSVHACQTHRLDELGVALHGHSFPNRAVPEDLSEGYRDAVPGFLNIGVLHTSADDPGEHETYAPCHAGRLALKGYEYWALGHIHARRVLHERPWIVFPGNLQGRHARETGPKGCTLVTVQDRDIVAVEHRAVDTLRWAALEVDATGLDIATLTGRVDEAVQRAVADAEGRPLLARLVLRGETPLHAALMADADRLAAECRSVAGEAGGELWIEKVQLRTRPPRAEASDLLGPLHQAFLAGLDDPLRVEALLAEMRQLRGRLPGAAQDGLDLPADAAAMASLADEAWQLAAAAILAEDRL